jgi:hypothetical protein
MKKAPIQ